MTVHAFYDVPAPAKLNLFLHVVGRRADGYHLLQSLFVLIDWCDTLHFERRNDGVLARHDLAAALPDDDLCLRAARALRTASSTSAGVDISIDKQVPWGAGLGGGSSDAATTLIALNRLWGLHWPRNRLMQIGLGLGADVPFFLGHGNAIVEGVGERLSPVELAPHGFAVLKPAACIDTRTVFASPLMVRNGKALETADILAGLFPGGNDFLARLFLASRNDLQAAAEAESSDVAQAVSWLEQRFGQVRMTGSGSAVFALTGLEEPTNPATALRISSAIADGLLPGWEGRYCRSLAAHPLAGWAEG